MNSPGNCAAIKFVSVFKVESDVVSLDGHDFLETDAEIGDDGKLHVTVRKSNVSRRSVGIGGDVGVGENDSRPSEFNGGREDLDGRSSRGPTPRPSNFEESTAPGPLNSPRFGSYPTPNPEITSTVTKTTKGQQPTLVQPNASQMKSKNDDKELHMFVWSSSASPVSEAGGLHVFGGNDYGATEHSGRPDHDDAKEIRMVVSDHNETKGVSDFRRDDDSVFAGGGWGESWEKLGLNTNRSRAYRGPRTKKEEAVF
ncbi:auxin efflux carrier [Tanacetum coccineum]